MYIDTLYQYKVLYPSNWEAKYNSSIVLFYSPKDDINDQFRENVNVIIQDLSNHPLNISEYTDLTKKQIIDALGEGTILSIKDVKLADYKAKEIIYKMNKKTLDGKDFNLQFKQVYFLQDNIAYLITYTAEITRFEQYLVFADKMINSFSLLQNIK